MKQYFFSTAVSVLLGSAAYAAPVDLTTMTLNGDATLDGTSILLTDNVDFQTGSAFIGSPFALGAGTTFSAQFALQISENGACCGSSGADGITFTIQNAPAGANSIGITGSNIGYGGISPSVAVEFDTWNNGAPDNSSNNHVGINVNGSTSSVALADPGFTLQDAAGIFAWVDYDGSVLDVFVSDANSKPVATLLSQAVDLSGLGGQGFFGFTAATGDANSEHRVTAFDLDVSIAPIPLPASIPLLGAGVLMLGALRRFGKR